MLFIFFLLKFTHYRDQKILKVKYYSKQNGSAECGMGDKVVRNEIKEES